MKPAYINTAGCGVGTRASSFILWILWVFWRRLRDVRLIQESIKEAKLLNKLHVVGDGFDDQRLYRGPARSYSCQTLPMRIQSAPHQ